MQAPSQATAHKTSRKRRKRCGSCAGCTRKDCGQCKNCKDMVKFGGAGKKKQVCLHRQCADIAQDGSPPKKVKFLCLQKFFFYVIVWIM